MAFFKRELSPVERFESTLKFKQAERDRLTERLRLSEVALVERRTAAEKLAVAGAANARLERAEASMREVEERARAATLATNTNAPRPRPSLCNTIVPAMSGCTPSSRC